MRPAPRRPMIRGGGRPRISAPPPVVVASVVQPTEPAHRLVSLDPAELDVGARARIVATKKPASEQKPPPPPSPPIVRFWRWIWRSKLGERHGQRFRVVARGDKNSVLIEFDDGYQCVTSCNACCKPWATDEAQAPAGRSRSGQPLHE